MNRRGFLGLLGATPLLLTGCGKSKANVVEEGFTLFNLPITLRFADTSPELVNRAVNTAQDIIGPLYHRIHPWKPSDLTRLNHELAKKGQAETTPEIIELIGISRRLYRATDGVFDPAIGGLIAAWGFHNSHVDRPHALPSDDYLDNWLKHAPSMADVHVDGRTVSVSNRRVQFDFNAIAEGFAARKIIKAIEGLGVKNCVFDPGGDLTVIGDAGDRPWHLGIEDPLHHGVLGGIDLSGHHALFSSGDYEHRFIYRGQSYSHIINPRTARPVRGIAGTTVLCDDPVIADGAATAMMMLMPEEAAKVSRRLDLSGCLLMEDNGQLWMTPSLQQAIKEAGGLRTKHRDIRSVHLLPS